MNRMTAHRHALLIALLLLTTLATARLARAGDEIDQIIPGEVMVRLNEGIDIQDIVNDYAGVLGVLNDIASRNIHLLQVTLGQEFIVQQQLLGDPRTRWAEANYEGYDPEGRTGTLWVAGVHGFDDYEAQFIGEITGRAQAHAITTGAGIVIAVIDTGVDATHPALSGSILPGGWNFVDDNADTSEVAEGFDDDGDGMIDESYGHGTFIAGLVKYMAPDAGIIPIKVLTSDGNGDGFLWAAGAFHAIDLGVDVINMSMGSTYKSEALEDAVEEAAAKGIITVGAAGNLNLEREEFPAVMSKALGIGSTDENDHKASFSNYVRKELTICAPGTGIISTIPEDDDGNLYAEWEGTSMSTALVSGAAALLVAAHPEIPPSELRVNAVDECLQDSAAPIDDELFDEDMLGAGRLDIAAALQCTPPPDAVIDAFTVAWGSWLSGGVFDLDDSDDFRLITRSRLGFSAFERNLLDLRIQFDTLNPLGIFDLLIESHINNPNGTAKVRFRNWNTGSFEQIAAYAVSQNVDTEFIMIGVNGVNYIGQGDGGMEMSLKHVVAATFSAVGFDSKFDVVEIEFED